MEIKYRSVESTIRPLSFEIAGDMVYLRKDISEVKRTMDDQTITYWTYQEAILTNKDFNNYANAMLVSGQLNGNESQLVIMDAIADLYDIVASMM